MPPQQCSHLTRLTWAAEAGQLGVGQGNQSSFWRTTQQTCTTDGVSLSFTLADRNFLNDRVLKLLVSCLNGIDPNRRGVTCPAWQVQPLIEQGTTEESCEEHRRLIRCEWILCIIWFCSRAAGGRRLHSLFTWSGSTEGLNHSSARSESAFKRIKCVLIHHLLEALLALCNLPLDRQTLQKFQCRVTYLWVSISHRANEHEGLSWLPNFKM